MKEKKIKKMSCSCGRTVKVYPPYEGSVVGHGHCMHCDLEWHLTLDGRFYSHPIRRSKTIKPVINQTKPIEITLRDKESGDTELAKISFLYDANNLIKSN